MTRYFFHLRAPAGLSPDEVGILLPNDNVVRAEAVKAVRHILRASPQKGSAEWQGWTVEVVDHTGKKVLSLPFEQVAVSGN